MVDIPNDPSSLGLPFNSWRQYQAETIAGIVNSAQPTILFESPTGSGKTAVAMGVLMATSARGMILTHSIALQHQYASTYPSVASIIGSSNFAQEAAGKLPHEYVEMRDRGMAAQITVTNYSWFLNAANRWKVPDNIDWLILDEAHLIEDAIGNFITVELDRSTCRELGVDLPRTKNFLEMHLFCLLNLPKISEALDHVRTTASEEFQVIEELEHLEWVMRLITQPGGNWLMSDHDGCLEFKSSRPGWFTSNLLLRHAGRHLLMSGTILDHEFFARTLGIRHPKSIILPNTVNAAQRPVVYRPTTSMSKRNRAAGPGALNAVREAIDGIMRHHHGQRGVIHTGNYEISKYIMDHSAFRARLISHEDAATREHALRRFLETPGAVLVSPSMDVGTDLPGESARWQIICKIPFPYLGDDAVMMRMKSDPRWYAWKTLTRLIQACGRIVRGEDDHGITYILDTDLTILQRDFDLTPSWFREALLIEHR